MNIVYVFAGGRRDRLDGIVSGDVPTEFFYGGEELRASGHGIEYVEIGQHVMASWKGSWVDRLFRWGLLPNRCRGHEMLGTKAIIKEIARADVVVATSTGIAFSLGIWRWLGQAVPPLVCIHCGIFNFPPNLWRKMLMSHLLRQAHSVVFGEAEAEPMRRVFGLDNRRIVVNQFGVDTSFWCPGHSDDLGAYILAVGNDARRDYATLIEAARSVDPHHRIKILTRLPLPERLPENVEVLRADWKKSPLTDGELRDLYRGARVVVTPLHDSIQPSGQSVTLQAMACGKPVILTHTGGLWDRDHIRDGQNIRLLPPGDSVAMALAIKELWTDKEKRNQLGSAARASVENHFSILGFATGLAAVCEQAIESSPSKTRKRL